MDNHAETASQLELQNLADNTQGATQLNALQDMANGSAQMSGLDQLQAGADGSSLAKWPSMKQLKRMNAIPIMSMDKFEGNLENNDDESARAQQNWGKMQKRVVGNTARVDEEMKKSQLQEELKDPAAWNEAATETRRKRLTGGDWEDKAKIDAAVNKDGKHYEYVYGPVDEHGKGEKLKANIN